MRKSKPRALSPHTNGTDQSNRNSWPDGEAAPPLPPRGCTPDKRNAADGTPPAPPKRLAAKSSLDGGDNISNGSGETQSVGSAEWGPVIDTSEPPILSPRSQQPPAPPPIPPKVSTTPSAASTTPIDLAAANENYSVPPRLRSSTLESTNSTASS
jgi:hypothetical protein